MANNISSQYLNNGFRNATLRYSLVSDGTAFAAQKIVDASSAGPLGVNLRGQSFYPQTHIQLVGMDFDVQGMGFALYWEATVNELIGAYGASPESFDWRADGGFSPPAGLAGATGSILLSLIAPAANASLFMMLRMIKNAGPALQTS